MPTRIAQIARTAIQEIDRIAQIVRTNEPVLEMNGPQVLRVMKGPQVPLVQKAVKAGSAFLIQSLRCERPEESVFAVLVAIAVEFRSELFQRKLKGTLLPSKQISLCL